MEILNGNFADHFYDHRNAYARVKYNYGHNPCPISSFNVENCGESVNKPGNPNFNTERGGRGGKEFVVLNRT